MNRALIALAGGLAAAFAASGAHAASSIPGKGHYTVTRIITQATPPIGGGQCLPVGTRFYGIEVLPAAGKTGFIWHHNLPLPGTLFNTAQEVLGDVECGVTNNGTLPNTPSGSVSLTCSVVTVDSNGALFSLGSGVFPVTYNFLQVTKESFYETVNYFDPIDGCTYSGIDTGFLNK
jgi:hypothetical protein